MLIRYAGQPSGPNTNRKRHRPGGAERALFLFALHMQPSVRPGPFKTLSFNLSPGQTTQS